MTPLVWANFPLAVLFILAFAGIPLWMTFKRPQTPPDHSQGHAYLAAKAALADAGAPAAGRAPVPAGRGRTLSRSSGRRGHVPPRRRAEAPGPARQPSA